VETGVVVVVVGVEVTDVAELLELLVPPPVLFPLPIAVVIGPLSIYTPEMYQFSGAGVLTIRRTPTWKSSELVEVEAATLFATLVKGEPPVENHRPTV